MNILSWSQKRRLVTQQLSRIDAALAERMPALEAQWQARAAAIQQEMLASAEVPPASPRPTPVAKRAPEPEPVPDYLR